MDKYGVVTPLWARNSKLPSIDDVLRYEYSTKYSFGETPGERWRQARRFAINTRAAYTRMWGRFAINISADLAGFRDALLQAQGSVQALAAQLNAETNGGVKYYTLPHAAPDQPMGILTMEKPMSQSEVEKFRTLWEARRAAGSLISTHVL